MSHKIERDCPVCGTAYLADPTRLKHGRQTTCSRACSYELRASDKRDRVMLNCGTCGREFERRPANVKGKHGANFCSPE